MASQPASIAIAGTKRFKTRAALPAQSGRGIVFAFVRHNGQRRYTIELMIKRLLLAGFLWFSMATCLSHAACRQEAQPQSGNDATTVQAQQAPPQPTPAPSTNAKKGSAS